MAVKQLIKRFENASVFIVALSLLAVAKSTRLSRDVFPEHYSLKVITYLEPQDENPFTFEGSVLVRIRCVKPVSFIEMNVKNELGIDEEYIEVKGPITDTKPETPRDIIVVQATIDEDLDLIVIELREKLQPGMIYSVYIRFTGKLEKSLIGYYRSSYVEQVTGKKRWIAVTQFEPTDARRAFPCFDEPDLKARFNISLGLPVDSDLTAISNMPRLYTEPIRHMPGWEWHHFEESLPMSTYLVAYMVSPLVKQLPERKPNTTKDLDFGIWTRPEAVGHVKEALDLGSRLIAYFEDYFHEPYPLPKLELAAIPDFGAGAVENWGLITFRENYVLMDNSTPDRLKEMANAMSHVIAHQWFGNLVTLRWWTELWLNEGFAIHVASLALENIEPTWKHQEEKAAETYLSVTDFDSLYSSHALSARIGSDQRISQVFDSVSYAKGSFILRMINLLLGENTFREGVSSYLKSHRFQNIDEDSLWGALTELAHKEGTLPDYYTVKEIMETWTTQMGYPVVTVTRDYGLGIAIVRQQRFFFGLPEDFEKAKLKKWWIPLSYTFSGKNDFSNLSPKQWLPESPSSEVLGLPGSDEWVIFNIQASGLYRVNYDEKNWKLILAEMNSRNYSKINVVNRVQLIDDSLNLARVGTLNYKVTFDLLNYLKREKEYLPWRAALRGLRFMDRMLERTASYGGFQYYVRKLLFPIYQKIEWKGFDEVHDTKLQAIILQWACKFLIGDCVGKARTEFKKWQQMEDPDSENPIASYLRPAIYCTAIRNGGFKDWIFAWKRYLNSTVISDKTTILSALGCTKQEWLLKRYLDWTNDEGSGIRAHHRSLVFKSVSQSNVGFYVAFRFLKKNYRNLYNRYGQSVKSMEEALLAIGEMVNDELEISELSQVLEDRVFNNIRMILDQIMERARINVHWLRQHSGSMMKALQHRLNE